MVFSAESLQCGSGIFLRLEYSDDPSLVVVIRVRVEPPKVHAYFSYSARINGTRDSNNFRSSSALASPRAYVSSQETSLGFQYGW